MRRRFDLYLWDIRDGCELIGEYTAGKTFEEFAASTLIQDAVERRFEIIGEVIAQCKIHFPGQIEALSDHSQIVQFRNFLIHRYDLIDHRQVWSVIHDDLPKLRAEVDEMLKAYPAETPS